MSRTRPQSLTYLFESLCSPFFPASSVGRGLSLCYYLFEKKITNEWTLIRFFSFRDVTAAAASPCSRYCFLCFPCHRVPSLLCNKGRTGEVVVGSRFDLCFASEREQTTPLSGPYPTPKRASEVLETRVDITETRWLAQHCQIVAIKYSTRLRVATRYRTKNHNSYGKAWSLHYHRRDRG